MKDGVLHGINVVKMYKNVGFGIIDENEEKYLGNNQLYEWYMHSSSWIYMREAGFLFSAIRKGTALRFSDMTITDLFLPR